MLCWKTKLSTNRIYSQQNECFFVFSFRFENVLLLNSCVIQKEKNCKLIFWIKNCWLKSADKYPLLWHVKFTFSLYYVAFFSYLIFDACFLDILNWNSVALRLVFFESICFCCFASHLRNILFIGVTTLVEPLQMECKVK